jgi:hypothetical protein
VTEKWQSTVVGKFDQTDRLAVPGGWIYRCREWSGTPTMSTVFVPDSRPTYFTFPITEALDK